MMWGGYENNLFRIIERGVIIEVYVGLLYF